MRSWLMILAACVGAAACSVFGPDSAENVRIEGHVYARCVGSSTVAGPCTNTNPISGAIVSTSLDSVTATTDASGAFDLKTNAPKSKGGCNTYTLTVTAGGYPTYSRAGSWGTHPINQNIVLEQGWPDTFGPCS